MILKKQIITREINFKKILLNVSLLIITLLPANSYADTTEANINKLNPTFSDIQSVINIIINRIPIYLGGLAFLAILYSGAIYIASFGDPSKMEQAKKNLTWTVTGIIAIASIYGIITVILWITDPSPLT